MTLNALGELKSTEKEQRKQNKPREERQDTRAPCYDSFPSSTVKESDMNLVKAINSGLRREMETEKIQRQKIWNSNTP